jgi:hypothetical protein
MEDSVIGMAIDVDKALERLDSMARKIRHLDHVDIPHEMRDWEVEDVHRKRPGTHRGRRGGHVLFRLHSWYEVRRSRLAQRRIHYRGRTSQRDVLGAELIDKLIQRLDLLMQEKLKW